MVYFNAQNVADDIVKSALIDAFTTQLKEFGCEIIEFNVQNQEIKFRLPPIAEKINLDIKLDV